MSTVNNQTPNTGLLAIWAQVDPGFVLQYQEWHNCEHIPERVSIPGFINGRRYRTFSDAPRYLMMYETQSLGVLSSDAYLAALNDPSPRSVASLSQFITPVRSTFELIAESGHAPDLTAPYLLSLRFNLADKNLLPAYRKDWLDALCQQDVITRVRLFQSDEATSSIETSERKIFSDGPGQRQYLALIEFNQPFNAADNPVESASQKVFPQGAGRTDELEDRHWLEISYKSTSPDNEVSK